MSSWGQGSALNLFLSWGRTWLNQLSIPSFSSSSSGWKEQSGSQWSWSGDTSCGSMTHHLVPERTVFQGVLYSGSVWRPVPDHSRHYLSPLSVLTCPLVADDDPLEICQDARPVVQVPGDGVGGGVVGEEVHLVREFLVPFSPEVGVKTTRYWIKYSDRPIGLPDVGDILARETRLVDGEAGEVCLEVEVPLSVTILPSEQSGETPGVCRPVRAAALQDDGDSPSDISSGELCRGQVTPQEEGWGGGWVWSYLLYSRDSVRDSFVNGLCLGLIIFRTAEVQVIPDTRRVDSSLIISIVNLH